jgi:ATP-dependent DNA helicase DinG
MGNVSKMPAPRDIGLPQKFSSWRRNQEDAINEFVDCKQAYLAQCMPTGSGKSLTYVADAVLTGMRTVILTSTKALQTQLMGDFAEIGMVDIKGKNAYRCLEDRYGRGCDYGDCNFGLLCARQKPGGDCYYYRALDQAKSSPLVVTNYAYWLTMNRFAEGLKHADLLVLDEAHHAENHLASIYSFHIRPKEIDSLLNSTMPRSASTLLKWADDHWAKADKEYEREKFEFQQRANGDKDHLRKLKSLRDRLETLRKHVNDRDWLVELQDGVKFCPIWPKQFARKTLFANTGRVLMTSATVRPKTVEMLGLTPRVGRGDQMSRAEVLMAQVGKSGPEGSNHDCVFSDYPSIFDPERRLVIHIPTVRINKDTKPGDYATWIARIDQIIAPRLHQKGIIHTVSYDRRDYVMEHSLHAEYMITHQTESVVSAVNRFKQSDPPCVLVSPSVTTGFDFPFDFCRWQIIGKIPFPDTRDRLTKARVERDPEYGAYLAMQSLVQASGRGTRAPNDSCVSFLIDDSAFWFMRRYRRFAPRWFMDGYRTSDLIPQVQGD